MAGGRTNKSKSGRRVLNRCVQPALTVCLACSALGRSASCACAACVAWQSTNAVQLSWLSSKWVARRATPSLNTSRSLDLKVMLPREGLHNTTRWPSPHALPRNMQAQLRTPAATGAVAAATAAATAAAATGAAAGRSRCCYLLL